jgi:cbb3-type cytochrome oxidase subunit 3
MPKRMRGGSEIHGFLGTIVHCPVNDTSFFCRLTKFIQIIFMIGFLILIVVLIYGFIKKKLRKNEEEERKGKK